MQEKTYTVFKIHAKFALWDAKCEFVNMNFSRDFLINSVPIKKEFLVKIINQSFLVNINLT